MAARGIEDAAAALNDDDKRLLTLAQRRVPVEPRPFRSLGEFLGLSEDAVIARLRFLKEGGFIRRIGPVFEPAALGLSSELIAARVVPDGLDRVGAEVAAWPEVTHCYGREHEVNLWFAGVAATSDWFGSAAEQVARMEGVRGVWRLPTIRRFKIDVVFELAAVEEPKRRGAEPHPPSPSPPLDCARGGARLSEVEAPRAERGRQAAGEGPEHTRGEVPLTPRLPWAPKPWRRGLDSSALLEAIQSDLPLCPRPFEALAEQGGVGEDELIATLAGLLETGAVRRFGALVSHRRLGFTANAMVVMELAPDRIEEAGTRLAESPRVSHCYQRPPFPGFPYSLYAMVHGQSRDELTGLAGHLAQSVGAREWQALFSTVEYRKSAPDYARLVARRRNAVAGDRQ